VVAELWLAPDPAAGRRVLEAAHHLLRAAGTGVRDLDRIVVGVGPGGFTGLRIGIATALGLGQALGCPVSGVVSLEALALGIAAVAPADALLLPVVDARRREVFAAAYRAGEAPGSLREVMAPVALPPDALAVRLAELGDPGPVVAAGDGAGPAGDALRAAGVTVPPGSSPAHRLSAAHLVARDAAGGSGPATPRYARLPDAEVNRLRALAAAER
jgi:tRNA threonylcarbamoyladenosine biosynthesis protein TsaB